ANLAFDPEAARAFLTTNEMNAADHAVRSLISFLAPATVRPAPLVQYSIRMSRTVGSVSFRPANRTRSAAVALTSSVLKSAMVTPPNQTRCGTLQSHDRRLQAWCNNACVVGAPLVAALFAMGAHKGCPYAITIGLRPVIAPGRGTRCSAACRLPRRRGSTC